MSEVKSPQEFIEELGRPWTLVDIIPQLLESMDTFMREVLWWIEI